MGIVSKIIWILVLAGFAVSIHAGFIFGKPYIDYRFFEADATELMRFKFQGEGDMQKRILKLAEENNIPLEYHEGDKKEGLEIWPEDERGYLIIIKWSRTVDYYGLFEKTFKYELEYKI